MAEVIRREYVCSVFYALGRWNWRAETSAGRLLASGYHRKRKRAVRAAERACRAEYDRLRRSEPTPVRWNPQF